jgi:PTH1 family peptidyl-tRNA hydrolase
MSFWKWLSGQRKSNPLEVKKYLIVGLGNIGATYHNTRHNIGFEALDALAEEKELSFEELRYGALTKTKFKGRTLLLLKPSTFMNNSGKAVRYWAIKENIPLENILIITDDLNLPFGTLRLKTKGSDGGHNGLKDIQAQLNTTNYSRLRFGIHSEEKGYNTVDFVLGKWSTEENKALSERCEMMIKLIFSFATQGAQNTMNQFNGK